MWWPFQWLVIYILGGLTFLPLLIALIVVYVIQYGSVPIGDDDPDKLTKNYIQADSDNKSLEFEEHNLDNKQDGMENREGYRDRASSSVGPSVSGWLTVRRRFNPHRSSSATNGSLARTNPGGSATATTSEDTAEDSDLPTKGVVIEKDLGGPPTACGNSTPTSSAPASSQTPASKQTYTTRIAQTYRTILPRSRPTPPPKEYFYCVLKSSVLFLYADETQSDCFAAIGLEDYVVQIESDEGKWEGKDGEMFTKRHAVVLRVKKSGKCGLPVLMKNMGAEENMEDELMNRPIFLFSKSNTKMEDWYLALLAVSSQSPTSDSVFSTEDMQNLVDTIDTEPDPIPMRWFNALIGRVFFGFYKTETFEQFIIGKMMKKLSKVQRPSFLGPIMVREVNVGKAPPFLSKPMLKNLASSGDTAFEVHLAAKSQSSSTSFTPSSSSDDVIRLTVATTATIPTGFKPYVVDLVLAVVLKSIEGNMLVQIKGPPSNRIWYGFTQMPKMELEIIPVVSERKIQIGMVLNAIEKQLRDVVAESVVLPNMDDLAFFDTSSLPVRGGIFDHAAKIKRNEKGEKEDVVPVVPAPGSVETDLSSTLGGPSKEDPDSALPVTSDSKNSHQVRKSVTLDSTPSPSSGSSLDATVGTGGADIVRTDSAPAAVLASGPTLPNKKTAALTATRKWFTQGTNNQGGATAKSQSQSIPAQTQTVMGGFGSRKGSVDSVGPSASIPRRKSVVSDMTVSDDGGKERNNFGNDSEVVAIDVVAAPAPVSVPEGILNGHASNAADTSMSSLPPSLTNTPPNTMPKVLDTSPAASLSSVPTNNSPPLSISSTAFGAAAPASSASSLISSFRTRDKEALRAQMGSAKEGIKKWGVNWATKRKTGRLPGLDGEEDDDRGLHALYRPKEEEEDARDDEPLSEILRPQKPTQTLFTSPKHGPGGLTLQERLNAATLAEASSVPMTIPSSQSHRRSMSSSRGSIHGKSGSVVSASGASGSPSRWTPIVGKTTTGLVTDSASPLAPTATVGSSSTGTSDSPPEHHQLPHQSQYQQHQHVHPVSHGHTRRHSNTTSVNTQPTLGKSMVVPRVPKRPGQVTAIGSDDLSSSEGQSHMHKGKADAEVDARRGDAKRLSTAEGESIPERQKPLSKSPSRSNDGTPVAGIGRKKVDYSGIPAPKSCGLMVPVLPSESQSPLQPDNAVQGTGQLIDVPSDVDTSSSQMRNVALATDLSEFSSRLRLPTAERLLPAINIQPERPISLQNSKGGAPDVVVAAPDFTPIIEPTVSGVGTGTGPGPGSGAESALRIVAARHEEAKRAQEQQAEETDDVNEQSKVDHDEWKEISQGNDIAISQ